MKFSTIAGSLLLSSAALAVPLSEENLARREANRVARRARANKQSHVNHRVETASSDISAETYSSNWAGAVLIGSGYTSVTGTFVVPSVSVPSGGSSSTQYCAAAWVGIDGDTCGTAILQTGVNVCIENGEITNTAWYEWYPAAQEYWSSGDITISTGDTVTATVTASSDSGGTATVTNESTGETATYTFSGQTSELCETNAEWIMEDLSSGGGLLGFADFGTGFEFTGASAVSDGTTVDTSGATIMDIEQDGTVLTSSSASGNTVTISYE